MVGALHQPRYLPNSIPILTSNRIVTIQDRYQNQIRFLQEVFEKVFQVFDMNKPVDTWLSGFYRSNRQIGSKDRRRISNSIFGFLRWYGWLRKLPQEVKELAPLLGFLLDDHEPDATMGYWLDQSRCSGEILRGKPLEEKCALFSERFIEVSISDLNPEFIKSWSVETIAAFQSRPPVWVRSCEAVPIDFLGWLKTKQVAYRSHPYCAHAVEIASPVNLFESEAYLKGRVEVQDIASQGIGMLCHPQAEEIWWDACCGSGGKALQLASYLDRTGKVYATDIDKRRLAELQKRVSRSPFKDRIEAFHWDGKQFPDFSERPVHVLLDVPCSCSGTWRRSPELRWTTSMEEILSYARIQQNLMKTAAQVLFEGGKLVYATCSVMAQENEGVIDRFLMDHPEFEKVPGANPLTGEAHDGIVRFCPPEVNGNGMFAAVLMKT